MLYVVRHGQTDWNVACKIQGKTDIPLNENGLEQANKVKELLKNIEFKKVFSSPLLRAKKTAEIICDSKCSILTDERISERCMGNYEGMDPHSLNLDYLWDYSENTSVENVEPVKDLIVRVHNFLEENKKSYENDDILLVTHGGVYPAILTYFNGIPEDNKVLRQRIKNCEIVKFKKIK